MMEELEPPLVYNPWISVLEQQVLIQEDVDVELKAGVMFHASRWYWLPPDGKILKWKW
jgi:hypothetical protein